MNTKIKIYYKNIDEPIINNYLNDDKIKNLLHLSLKSDLYLFKKNKNKWKLKNTRQIVSECKKKKEKLKYISLNLKSLNKKNHIPTKEVKIINDKLINDMTTLDSIINNINNTNNIIDNLLIDKSSSDSEMYLEKFSN